MNSMSCSFDSLYKSLGESSSTIRILVVAPAQLGDDIYCWLLHVDLDADPGERPLSTQLPVNWPHPFRAQCLDGREREYKLDIDCLLTPQDDGTASLSRHPFQRYTALSYVWGPRENPQHITLNGHIRFPVTHNLYAALQTLRDHGDPSAGTKVWADAVCINQADHKEKEQQLQLLRRVYQQAQEVVAYVPQPPDDERNLFELFREILAAEDLFERYYVAPEDAPTSTDSENGGHATTVAASSFDPGMPYWDAFLIDQDRIHQRRAASSDVRFLEDFDLPPAHSPLWTSWRRFFASPYCKPFPSLPATIHSSYFYPVRRIWILQEFTLARTLTLKLGQSLSVEAETFIKVHYYLQFHSSAKTANYLGQFPPSTPQDFIKEVLAGVRCAGIMEAGRFSNRDRSGMKLVQKLYDVREFQATDPRDKVYAVLALVMDGEDQAFTGLVSYDPEVTPGEVYHRFARAMVKKGDGLEVLLQAGLGGDESVPSWVPVCGRVPVWWATLTAAGLVQGNPSLRREDAGWTTGLQQYTGNRRQQTAHPRRVCRRDHGHQ
jgi:hypothetical protein